MNSESRLYLNRARRDLKAAESNLELGYHYIAVSRSYYAMFYSASALLASKGVMRSKHSGVISAFGEYFVKTGIIEQEYAKLIGNAFDSRLDSDYDVAFTIEKEAAEDILADARQFVARVERYFEENE